MLDGLTLDQMRVFATVAETGSFRSAAIRLHRLSDSAKAAIRRDLTKFPVHPAGKVNAMHAARALHKAGVPLLAGTDANDGLHGGGSPSCTAPASIGSWCCSWRRE